MKINLRGTAALVIDNDPDSIGFLRAALEPCGVRLMTAHSGEEAKSLLETITPDIIITDLLAPDENGLAFIQWLRSRKEGDANLPAIAIASSRGRSAHEDAEAAGFTMFLSKPLDPMELVVAVALLQPRRRGPSTRDAHEDRNR